MKSETLPLQSSGRTEDRESSEAANGDAAARPLPQVIRPVSLAKRDWHRAVLAVSVAIILLSMILHVRDDQRVAVWGFAGLPIPESCGMQIMFRRDCPGCGLTRSFIHLAHGDWQRSVAIHRVGWLLALSVLLQIPYRLIALRFPSLTIPPVWGWSLGAMLTIALIVNWILKVLDTPMS